MIFNEIVLFILKFNFGLPFGELKLTPTRMASLPPPKREGGPRAGWHSWAVFALGTSGAAQDWGTPARPAVPAPAPDERIDRRLFTPSPGGRTSSATPWRLDATPPVPAQLDPSSSE